MSPKEWPTEKLVSECLAQKGRAWDELVRRYGPMIYGTVRRQLSRFGFAARKDLLEDAYQEVFLVLTKDRALGRLANPSALPGYLAAVAMSKAVDAIRSAARGGAFVEWSGRQNAGASRDQAADPRDGFEADLTACPKPNPRDEAAQRDLRDIIDREIAEMPDREALVVRLKWQHDMTLEAIARHMEIPAGTAATILRRTRETVRSRLREKGIEG